MSDRYASNIECNGCMAEAGMQKPVEQVFQVFLTTTDRFRLAQFSENQFFQFFETDLAAFDLLAIARVKAAVTFLKDTLEGAVFENFFRHLECQGIGIHPCDMGMEEIFRVNG